MTWLRDGIRHPVAWRRRAAAPCAAVLALAGIWVVLPALRSPVQTAAVPLSAAPEPGSSGGAEATAWADSDPIVISETVYVLGARAARGVMIPVAGITMAELQNTFGAPRPDGRSHAGIDIAAPRGTPVVAAVDGWVVNMSYSNAGGRGLHLLDRTRSYLLYYAHLDAYAEDLFRGMAVRQGELLGYVGTTGNAAAPHLHLEVGRVRSPGGLAVHPLNPWEFLVRGQ